jgi:hypothetical protein
VGGGFSVTHEWAGDFYMKVMGISVLIYEILPYEQSSWNELPS